MVLRERNSHTVRVLIKLSISKQPLWKAVWAILQPLKLYYPMIQILYFWVYYTQRKWTQQARSTYPLPVLKHNAHIWAMKWTQMLTGSRMEDNMLYVHSGVLFNHREWYPVIGRKMDRIMGHCSKWHEPGTGRRALHLLSQVWEQFFKHPPACRVVITKDWKDVGEGRLDKPRLGLVSASSVYITKHHSECIEMYIWYMSIKF